MENNMQNTPGTPKLVADDGWLAPQTDQINHRIHRFEHELEAIKHDHKSLYNYASGHLLTGIHYQKEKDQWLVREWVPNAKGIQIIGAFNDWTGEDYELKSIGHGLWEITLPGSALGHEQQIKLRVHGADDSIRDRIPACITRAVQDPETHDYTGQIWQPEEPYQWKHPDFSAAHITSPLIYEAHTGMCGE